MISNNNKPFDDIYLAEGGFIRIVGQDLSDMSHSILFILFRRANKWIGS